MYAHRSQPSVLVQEVVVINHGVCTQTSVQLITSVMCLLQD